MGDVKTVTKQRMIGLRNITCSKDDWFYLMFYDIDTPIDTDALTQIDTLSRQFGMSYILYKTLHGFHYVGLTPLDCITWAEMFWQFKQLFKSYYSGNVIRLSRKKDEIQEPIMCVLTYGEVIPNLYNLYCDRFHWQKKAWTREDSKFLLVFEKYTTVKPN